MLLIACSPSVSNTPLSNARPEGPEVYFYGAAAQGGKSLPQKPASAARKSIVLPKPPAQSQKKNQASNEKSQQVKDEAPAKGDAGVAPPPSSIAGRYLGTDTVVITFPGVPGDAQIDDQAIVDIEKREGEGKYTLVVVASNTGDPLCTIDGQWRETKLVFAEGQSCFEEILGVPLDSTLTAGSASFEGANIEVEFQLELAFDSPAGSLEGSVDYSFEGKKE